AAHRYGEGLRDPGDSAVRHGVRVRTDGAGAHRAADRAARPRHVLNITFRTAGIVALLVLLAVLPAAAPQVVVVQTTDILIFVLFALSLNLLVGYAGMLSLGHAAFFAIGGYGAGLLVKELGFAMPLALAAAPLLAAAAAVVIGFFCVRLSHAYFIMLSLAFGQLVFTVTWKWRSLTRRAPGLPRTLP